MAAKGDARTLEKTSTAGIYRRHAKGCNRHGRCRCPYVVRWKAQGKWHKQMFPTFELAREVKGTVASGKGSRLPLSSQVVGDFYAGWINSYRGRTARGVQKATVREYRACFERHILELPIARTELRDLTPRIVKEWFIELERRNASPATIRRARIALRVMLADAVENDEIASNPVADARYIPSATALAQHAKPKPRQLTAADVRTILHAMPERWRAMHFLLAQTGLRIGEMLGLRWKNVHLGDDAHIHVVEHIYRGERKEKPKTDASRRKVPLSAGMASMLVQIRPDNFDPDDLVFPSKTSTPLSYANLRFRVLAPALEAAGMAGERVTFHSFRRACASMLQAEGKRPAQAQGPPHARYRGKSERPSKSRATAPAGRQGITGPPTL
jgi:integrase